ncbi:peptidase domain-containing ABC transporter [Alteromonas sp. KUL49]|uniref:peptidase domain-containing ABC transporter n=1 Tax=Alteromonas sp. KUL49 TaxID=2480798 RepID=UPI00102F28CA|nr:peptidase domain-containing ABC transporter [Alteromonas sp. KUL49]TAP37953.1 peptidase domain-containing ABC transporter [Alteromonas sp. KUL49]GEA12822.1 ABC transporter [Alteromonas sp. KUL49]
MHYVSSGQNHISLRSNQRVPVILQAEAAECGLVCLNMIGHYYGDTRDMVNMRHQYSLSLRGASLKDIISIGSHMNFQCRALKLEMDDLTSLQTPSMLHWDMNHFVVLVKVTKKALTIHDPALGKQTLTFEQAAQHFTGVALEIQPNKDFTPVKAPEKLRLRDFFKQTKGFGKSIVVLFLLSALLQLFIIASPYYMQTVVDDVLVQNNAPLLTALAVGFCLLLLIETFTSCTRQLLILSLSSRLQLQMSSAVFKHLLSLPVDYFEKRHIGDVVSRFGSLTHIRDFLTTGVVTAILDGIMATLTLSVMFIYSPILSLVVVAIMLIYLVFRISLLPTTKRLTTEKINLSASEQSHFMESIRAIIPVRIYQQEIQRHGEWQNKLVNTLNKDISLGKLEITSQTVNHLLFGLENIIIIYVAAQLVLENTFSVGMLFAFIAYKTRFSSAFDSVVNKVIALRMLGLHFDRLSDIIFTSPEQQLGSRGNSPAKLLNNNSASTTPASYHLTASDLSYRYSSSEPYVFHQLNLKVTPGECVAIVGPSGTGKTTLLKCLMGLLTPTHGELTTHSIHHDKELAIAAVLQEDMCLSGTIADNIACFDEAPDLSRIANAAMLACLHQEIVNMPMQYNTLVGDMGTSLSGGQRQRLFLARALYRHPEILFLDEASSHLDLDNEAMINHHLKQLKITRIIVAHRPQTIAMADTVYQLSEGQLHKLPAQLADELSPSKNQGETPCHTEK